MGVGTTLNIINGTPYKWTKTNQHSYQMNNWDLPSEIAPNSVVQTYVECDQDILDTSSDDAGEADYSVDGTSSSFEIQAKYGNGPQIKLYLSGMSTLSETEQATIDLAFVWNGTDYPHYNYMTLIVAGVDGCFICNSSNQLSTAWLSKNLATLGQRTLRQICLPASHDSGMSTIGYSTAFGNAHDCQTQSKDIGTQLRYGVRDLDLRAVISHGDYYTGHYSDTGSEILGWQGADGQKISDVVDQINAFTDSFPELVIVRITHDYDTDNGYVGFNQQNWNGLLAQLSNLEHLFIAPTGTSDLTELTLNQFIGDQQAAVVVTVDAADGTLGTYAVQGFYYQSQFPL